MSTLILVPGFWLDARSWDGVTPSLEAAGHTIVPLTLPGLESVEADRSGIGLADHIDAVVAEIDRHGEPVVLVGHSGGGAIIHGAVDRRPDRVGRALYVDSGPTPDGVAINPHLPVDGTDIPLPPWDLFREDEASDLDGLDDATLERFRARAVPEPAAVARDAQRLTDERRFDVPVTLISTTFSRAEIDAALAADVPYFAELPRIRDVSIVELPTGHWPQFSRPDDLARAIAEAVG